MSSSELLLAGLKLMVCGMGMVFAFLVVMIIGMNIMRVVLAPFADALTAKGAKNKPAEKKDDLALVAAAVAAVDAARRQK